METVVPAILDEYIESDTIYEALLDCYSLGNVRLKKHLGPWDKNQLVNCLTFNFLDGTVQEHDYEGNIVKECDFEINFI